MLLPLFRIRFIWLYQVFPTYFIYWIAAYPVANIIHPLNNRGLQANAIPLILTAVKTHEKENHFFAQDSISESTPKKRAGLLSKGPVIL